MQTNLHLFEQTGIHNVGEKNLICIVWGHFYKQTSPATNFTCTNMSAFAWKKYKVLYQEKERKEFLFSK